MKVLKLTEEELIALQVVFEEFELAAKHRKALDDSNIDDKTYRRLRRKVWSVERGK